MSAPRAFTLRLGASDLLAGLLTGLLAAAPLRADVTPPTVTASLDRTEVPVGDRAVATWEASVPVGDAIELEALVTPKLPSPPAPTDGPVLEFGQPRLTHEPGGGKSSQRFTLLVPLTPFATGVVPVPGPRLVYVSRTGERVPFRPPSLTLNASSHLPQDKKAEELTPKADRPVAVPPVPLKVWIALALAIAAVAAVVVLLLRRRRKRAEGSAAAVPERPAGEELLLALDGLRARVPEAAGDPRGFYSDLTHAVKRYLERRLARPVLEWTTFETLRQLRDSGLDLPREVGLADLLSGADRVKFGRADASPREAEGELHRARSLHDHVEAKLRAREEAAASRPPAPARPPASAASVASGRRR